MVLLHLNAGAFHGEALRLASFQEGYTYYSILGKAKKGELKQDRALKRSLRPRPDNALVKSSKQERLYRPSNSTTRP